MQKSIRHAWPKAVFCRHLDSLTMEMIVVFESAALLVGAFRRVGYVPAKGPGECRRMYNSM
jgi:hypothetical protein